MLLAQVWICYPTIFFLSSKPFFCNLVEFFYWIFNDKKKIQYILHVNSKNYKNICIKSYSLRALQLYQEHTLGSLNLFY
jgi:hypothetical protein